MDAFLRALALAALLPLVAAAQQPAPATIDASADGPFVLGRKDAPVTLVEFSDYECGYCRDFHRDVFERLRKEFIDTGLVRYVARDFPLKIHANSVTTARAARCAAQQGKYWEMRHALYGAPKIDVDGVVEAGRGAGLDEVKLRDCVVNAKVNATILKDMEEGGRIGVRATPAFVIGRSKASRVEGTLLVGSRPYEEYASRIRALLPAR